MLRILFVTGSLVHGGAERHSITVMNGLAERGHECHAIFIKNDASQRDRILLRGNGSVRCLNAERYLDRRALTEFAAHIARIRPDIIVAANAYALFYASLARRMSGQRIPLLVTFHSTFLVGIKERIKMLVDRFFFLSADCLVFVCESQQRYWRRRAVFARRNEVIYNGVAIDRFRADEQEAASQGIRHRFGIAATDYVIGMVAVLRPEKNPVQLLEAVAALRAQGIPAVALLIGDGVMRRAIEALARLMKIEAFVVITGIQDDVRPYIAACNVVVLCSFTEAFSLAAIEAMAMARPVVHSAVGGAAEMIRPGHNGFLFPVNDTDALVRHLARLADTALSRQMGNTARGMVAEMFSEAAMLDRYEKTLSSLCASHSGRRDAQSRPAQNAGWWARQQRSSGKE